VRSKAYLSDLCVKPLRLRKMNNEINNEFPI
jgi:hypothetical protein